MLCKMCNKEIDDNSLVCPYCGSQISKNSDLNKVVQNNLNENNTGMNSEVNFSNDLTNNTLQTSSVQQVVIDSIQPVSGENISVEPSSVQNNIVEHTNEVSTQNTINDTNAVVESQEKVNVGLAILSWFIPLVGFILFFVKKKTAPKTAKASGICALISFLLSTLIIMLLVVSVVRFTNKVKDTLNESINQTIDTTIDNFDKIDSVIEESKDKIDEIQSQIDVKLDELQDIETLDNDWKKYEVKINNKRVVLPTSYQILNALTGFQMNSTEEKNYLAPNYYNLINLYKNDKYVLHVEIYNDSTEDVLNVNGKVTRIMQSNSQIFNGADVVYFPGNLKAGDKITHEKIIELFGEPTNKSEYNSEGYNSVEYTYNEDTTWTTTKYYKIRVVNDVIDELTLDNRR